MIHYKFPEIEHIDQCLEAIEGRDEFVVADRDDYKIINYVVQLEDSFPPVFVDGKPDVHAQIRRECRGIAFDRSGKVISRPYHKFFNLNERDETRNAVINLADWTVLEKVDGSMIRPLPMPYGLRLATKMGITDIAMQAETFLTESPHSKRLMEFMLMMMDANVTPIFEWCAPENQIVVRHPERRLVLTALRHNVSGQYLPVRNFKSRWPDVVDQAMFTSLDEVDHFLNHEGNEGIEGFVLRASTGHMLKIKGDWYLSLHKTKDAIRFEKDVLKIFVEERLDDLKPLLLPDDMNRIQAFYNSVMDHLMDIAETVAKDIEDGKEQFGHSRSEYAQKWVLFPTDEISVLTRPAMFYFFDKPHNVPLVMEFLLKKIVGGNLSSSTQVEKIRPLLGCKLRSTNEST